MKVKRAEQLAALERELDALIHDARTLQERYRPQLDQLHDDQRLSGLNLVHYLALRERDKSALQEALKSFGLSSLGRSGAHVLASLHAVRHALRALRKRGGKPKKPPVSFAQGHKLIKRHTRDLLGQKNKGSAARIMVTLPGEAADDPGLVRDLLEAGMNCARINCAQGGPEEWVRTLANLERARKATGRACRAFMDVSGPKIRTGPLVAGPRVLALRPKKDLRGMLVKAAPVVLVPEGEGAGPGAGADEVGDPIVPITAALFHALRPGDRVTFTDTRGRPRHLEVLWAEAGEARALCPISAYLETGLSLALERGGAEAGDGAGGAAGAPAGAVLVGAVGTLPSQDDPIVLHPGDTLLVHRDLRLGEPARAATGDRPASPAHVACAFPQVFDDVRQGESVVLDDGKARGFIREVRDGELEVEITSAPRGGMKLRGAKGINLPDSRLRIPSLTDQDREHLRFIAEHADGVLVSFVKHPDDVEDLLDQLDQVGGKHLGLIVKIETKQGFQHLPGILLAAMEWPRVGVMIARGDLAVEAGWVDLARLQEEILSVSEAAHVPVVWATEVLDRLARKGTPTRSEISDVVMAERAECVMLNKGPYIVDAIRTLEDVLRSVQSYQRKKTTLLPSLLADAPDPTEVGRAVGERQGRWKG